MKKLFYSGIALIVLFELANVYFIMPMPFSQRMRSIDLAYFLYTSRWIVRAIGAAMVLIGAPHAIRETGWRRAAPAVSLVVAALVVYMANFQMAADRIFLEPASVTMRPAAGNTVD